MTLRHIHRAIGVLTVVAFIATGVYLMCYLPSEHYENATIRFLFRANHTYILFAGLINLIAGLYLVRPTTCWRSVMQLTGSLMLLASPAVLMWAFIVEPPLASPDRILTSIGVFAMFIGCLMHIPAGTRRT